MKRLNILVLVIISLTFLAGCKSSKDNLKRVKNQFSYENISLQYEQIGCRGNCPDFNLTVKGDGKVQYKGRHAVDLMGYYEKSVPQKQVNKVIGYLDEYNFWEMQDVYGGEVADVPGIRIAYSDPTRNKTVTAYKDEPEEFNQLAEKILKGIGLDGLKKVD